MPPEQGLTEAKWMRGYYSGRASHDLAKWSANLHRYTEVPIYARLLQTTPSPWHLISQTSSPPHRISIFFHPSFKTSDSPAPIPQAPTSRYPPSPLLKTT